MIRVSVGWVFCSLVIAGLFQPPQRAIAADDTGEQTVGKSFYYDPTNLPAIKKAGRVTGFPQRVERNAEDHLRVPDGFQAQVFAENLEHPRWMALAPNGDVFLAESRPGKVTILRDSDGDGIAEERFTYVSGLQRPHGIAFWKDKILIADVSAVWQFDYRDGDVEARGKRQPITEPGALGKGGGHWTRNLAVSPDGERLYVAVGSRNNIAEEADPHATVQEFSFASRTQSTYTSGLRNPVGIGFYPGRDDLYVVVNERDGYGNNMVPDYLTRVSKGAFFGWPYAYLGPNADPDWGEKDPAKVAATQVPDVLFEAHSAPVGLVFYDGDQFPADYRGDAFVALHGSWNSSEPTGYKIVRVPFENGRPTSTYENFAAGFWRAGEKVAEVWGRPAGLLIAADGSLLIADDTGKTIWRISYSGK